jgi:hypothetical protein
MREAHTVRFDEEGMRCPACNSVGRASGSHTVEWRDSEERDAAHPSNHDGIVWFSAERFTCPICGLRLDDMNEIDKVTDPVWEMEPEESNPYDYANPPPTDD